jgi:DNA polymerase elongation subunit (family B)
MGRSSHSLEDTKDAAPDAERRSILLRAYAEVSYEKHRSKAPITPEWVLVFDTETTPDEAQRLRFGVYQLLQKGQLRQHGLFYDDVKPAELEALKTEAPKHGCVEPITVFDFIHKIFLPTAFKAGGLVVGFNLPFDLSRLAIRHEAARVSRAPRTPEEIAAGAALKDADRSMVGGFTFQLSPFSDQPFLRIKHLNSRSAFFRFAKPAHQEAARSQRRRGERVQFQRGNFLDVKTLAAALTSKSHRLETLADYLGVKHKGKFTDFARPIDAEFIDYAVNDVETTRQCFEELVRRYQKHRLGMTAPQGVYSEAGLGKAYLKQMSVRPWREVQSDFDPATLGAIMSSYFGGRAEVHIRRTVVPTLYCDFASMYPTVCTLMGLWRFVIAQGIDDEDATAETQTFLDDVKLNDLQDPRTWERLTTLVQVKPDADIFPVRARYAARIKEETKSSDMPTIGVNYLSANRPLWFTLADCIASKLLSSKAPSVIRAVRFSARQAQAGLRAVEIAGEAEYRVIPDKNDFYKRVIELRRRVKGDLKDAERRDPDSQEVKNLDMNQLALKILANATSYGIFIELNVEDGDDEDALIPIFTSQGKRTVPTPKRELPGRYYHPLLATLITGAARLMLALTERLAVENDLNWAFCDTDSMAFANTEKLPYTKFVDRVRAICQWFVPLNPYEPDPKKGAVSILEMENQNFSKKKGKENELEPLYCFAISAKRYALFNRDGNGKPIIRKASAHGLGHFSAPYGHEEESRDERGSGVRLWEEDVWKQIISAALSDRPREVDYTFRSEMLRPAHSRYGSTRPAVLNWFKRYNEGRPYAEQVKPFNFLLTFFIRRQEDIASEDPTYEFDPKLNEIRPVAPYEKDSEKALRRIFDRNSENMDPVSAKWLRTVADVLRDYHRQPEYKFLGGGWNEEGVLRRRHVLVDTIEDIGKESDGWEEDEARSEDQDQTLTYPSSSFDRDRMIALIKSVRQRELMREARIAMRTIDAVWRGEEVSVEDLKRMNAAAERIVGCRRKGEVEQAAAVAWLKIKRDEMGLIKLAVLVNVDAANLAKVIEGKRRVSRMLLSIIRNCRQSNELR